MPNIDICYQLAKPQRDECSLLLPAPPAPETNDRSVSCLLSPEDSF